jgi:hypothetical protein
LKLATGIGFQTNGLRFGANRHFGVNPPHADAAKPFSEIRNTVSHGYAEPLGGHLKLATGIGFEANRMRFTAIIASGLFHHTGGYSTIRGGAS